MQHYFIMAQRFAVWVFLPIVLALIFANLPKSWIHAFFSNLELVLFESDDLDNVYLRGNNMPVLEESVFENIPANIPKDLPSGVFLRIGPNAVVNERKNSYHWFDGHGMIHSISMKQGGNTLNYSNQWIKNENYYVEREAGWPLTFRIGALKGFQGLYHMLTRGFLFPLLGIVPQISLDSGTANTAFLIHQNRLFALNEASYPFEITLGDDGKWNSSGYYSLEEWNYPVSAHVKVDEDTKELILFGYAFEPKYSAMKVGVLSPDRKLISSVNVDLPKRIMAHDFSITKHYSIILDFPLVFDPKKMVSEKALFNFDKNHPSRIGVLPRYAKSPDDIKWFTVEDSIVIHVANSFEIEEENKIVLIASRLLAFDFKDLSHVTNYLYQWTLNLEDGKVEEKFLNREISVDFPVIHPKLYGKKNRFVFGSILDKHGFKGIMKYDLAKEETLTITYPSNTYGGEARFVPRDDSKSEDDGYLMTFLHNSDTNISSFAIFDAKEMNAIPIMETKIPVRVPYGFHSAYVKSGTLS
jgi:carotenoid cleavage dioxygenase-like enzyme